MRRMTGRTGKAQRDQMFSGLPPKADFPIPFANSSRNAAIAASRVGS
jgi:hypothetical protein